MHSAPTCKRGEDQTDGGATLVSGQHAQFVTPGQNNRCRTVLSRCITDAKRACTRHALDAAERAHPNARARLRMWMHGLHGYVVSVEQTHHELGRRIVGPATQGRDADVSSLPHRGIFVAAWDSSA